MNFSEFKDKYLNKPVIEYPNNRGNKIPLVTVKVVTYNHAKFIKECLDSILMQKANFDFEILIAEDDSNDGTREICIEYADKYSDKIRLFLNSRENNIFINNRPSGTFNSVYANFCIHSKYIAFIEGDDYWTDKLSLQKRFNFLENNENHVMCFHNSRLYYQELDQFDTEFRSPLNKSISIDKDEMFTTILPTLTFFYRNGLVDVFEENMLNVLGGDVILKGKLSNYGKARYIHEIEPAVYRIHNGGVYSSRDSGGKNEASLQAELYLLKYYENKNWELRFLNEKIFLSYFKKFVNDIFFYKKIKLVNLKKCIFYFFKSDNKKYCGKIFFNIINLWVVNKIKNN